MTKRERIIEKTRKEVKAIIFGLNEELAEQEKRYAISGLEVSEERKDEVKRIIAAYEQLAEMMDQIDDNTIFEWEGRWIGAMQNAVSQMAKCEYSHTLPERGIKVYLKKMEDEK